MNKTVVGILVALVALGGIGLVVMNMNNKDNPSDSTTTQTTSNTQDQPATSNQNTVNPESNQTQTAETKVDIKNQAFNPSKITVKAGTKVTWTNQDSVQHDVAPDKDYGDDFKPSEMLSRGESYSFTFNKAGTYEYHCTPHPFMKATVVVTE